MNDKLPSDAPNVNTPTQQLIFYPEAGEATARAARIITEVDTYFIGSRDVGEAVKERAALLAIDSVRYLAARNFCLCLTCLLTYATGDRYLWYCLRAEVLEVIGRPALKIAHRAIVSD